MPISSRKRCRNRVCVGTPLQRCLLGILWCCGQMGIVKGQCGEQVRIREIGVEQTAQLALCVPLVEPLLDFGGWLAPLPPPRCLGIYWIDHHFHILPAMIFLLSVPSLHCYFLSQMVVVLIPYTSQPYGRLARPVCNRRCAPCRQAAALPIDCGTHCALPCLRHWRRSGSWPSASVTHL